MEEFGKRLRDRAQQLGLSNADVARELGLSERRYAHYVTGDRQPDLGTLVRIASALSTSPNWLLDFDGQDRGDAADLVAAAEGLPKLQVELLIAQANAVRRYLKGRA